MTDVPGVVALVPMRETSERVPGKNYRQLCGRPLYAWILETLQASRYISEIVVNTDSERIGKGAEELGARVLWRPESLRGAMVNIQPLLGHDLAHAEGSFFLQTHSTNPLLKPETVDRAIEAFFASDEHDCLFSVTPHQTRFYWDDGRPVNHDPQLLERTQDLAPLLEENSCIYVFSRAVYEDTGHRIGRNPLLFPMDPLEAIDIDEESDMLLADVLMHSRLGLAWSGGGAGS